MVWSGLVFYTQSAGVPNIITREYGIDFDMNGAVLYGSPVHHQDRREFGYGTFGIIEPHMKLKITRAMFKHSKASERM